MDIGDVIVDWNVSSFGRHNASSFLESDPLIHPDPLSVSWLYSSPACMSLSSFGRALKLQLSSQQPAQCCQQQRLSRLYSSTGSSSSAAGGKKAEQLSDEELKAALPSMLFTTSNLIWSTTLAVGVAAAGLLCMFQVGTWITGAAQSLKHLEQPAAAAAAPAPAKTLAELIADRKAELQQQLSELEALPRTTEVRQAIAATRKELRQFRDPGQSWWRLW